MDHVESDLICQNGHDYTFLDYAPLLCDFCDEPLTLTMDAVADLKQSAAGTSQLTDKALIHTHQRLVDSNTNQGKAPITAYQDAMAQFRAHLHSDDFQKISRSTTFSDVVAELVVCKNAQQKGTRKQGKSQQHLDKLLERIHHYSSVIDSAAQGSPELVNVVWASIKFLVQVTSSYLSMQVKLISMLSEIAENIGRVELFRDLFPSDHMRCTVAMLYAEVVDALRSMITFWQRRRLDKRIFHAFWNPFEVEYQGTLERIRYLVDHVDRTASASHMVVTKTQNDDILLAIQGMQARLDEHQNMFLILCK
ncbi:hypothetical protein BDW60DRAFT_109780 [Aspergillus nidulans var. acristatus]